MNFGNVATYETEKNVGFGIALGYEYFNGGLIRIGEASGVSKPKRSVFEPVVELNLRYWSKANFAKEISLLAGFGSKNAADIDYSNPANPPSGSIKGSFHFRLMWSTYINY